MRELIAAWALPFGVLAVVLLMALLAPMSTPSIGCNSEAYCADTINRRNTALPIAPYAE